MQRLQPLKISTVRLLGLLNTSTTRDLLTTHNVISSSSVVFCRTLSNSSVVRSEPTSRNHRPQSHRSNSRNSVKVGIHPTRLRQRTTGDEKSYNSRISGQFNRGKGVDFDNKYRQKYTKYTKRPVESVSGEGQDGRLQDETTHDPGDVFGMLNSDSPVPVDRRDLGSKYDSEPDSDGEDQWQRPRGRRNVPYWFAKQMKNLCKEGKLKEAIEMLEIRMLKVERVQPTAMNYNILIGACGRVGYTKMAFKLYNNMKKRGILPEDATYTALINACAESPWPTTDGIARLRQLHGQLQQKGININLITCHALMKAYAKCGDIEMTFNLFRHLLVSSPQVTAESFSFFLFACASDRKAGLTYAIQGWRCLQQRDLQHDKFTYNLLLRVARDCGIGELETANRVLLQRGDFQELLPPPEQPHQKVKSKPWENKKDVPVKAKDERIEIFPINPVSEDSNALSDEDDEYGDSETKHTYWWEEELNERLQINQTRKIDWTTSKSSVARTENLPDDVGTNLPDPQMLPLQDNLPNLLEASSSDLRHVVSLGGTDKPQNRLALIGGSRGILDKMKSEGIKPDIKTFGLLTEMIPYNKEAEKELMVAMDTAGVKGDIMFYNGLIRRRAIRRDVEGAKELLSVLTTKGLYPNAKTYGSLAIGCFKSEDGLELIEDMTRAGLKVNIAIFTALIGSANRVRDYDYTVKLLKAMGTCKVLPNKQLLEKLEGIASFHQSFSAKDADSKARTGGRRWTKNDEKGLNRFRQYYIPWLERVKMAKQEHPWDDYRPEKHQPPNRQDVIDR